MKAKHLTLSSLVLCVLTGCGNPDQGNTALDAAGEYRDDTAWAQHAYQGKPATQATIASQRVAELELPAGDFLDGSMMREHSSEIFRRNTHLFARIQDAVQFRTDVPGLTQYLYAARRVGT